MAGVMVVYGPPITHLPPPAVGASPDAAIHDFKGSCRRSVRITVGRSLPCLAGPGATTETHTHTTEIASGATGCPHAPRRPALHCAAQI